MKSNKGNRLEKHFELGMLYDEVGQYKDAIREYKLALKIDPLNSDILYDLGVAYGKLNLFKRSLCAYKKAIKANPCNGDAFYNAGVIYSQVLKLDHIALRYFSQAVILQEENGEALINIGCIYLDKNKISLAIFHFEKALLAPNAISLIPYVCFNYGEICEKQGDLLKAVYFYKKALIKMPKDKEEIEKILTKLSRKLLK